MCRFYYVFAEAEKNNLFGSFRLSYTTDMKIYAASKAD